MWTRVGVISYGTYLDPLVTILCYFSGIRENEGLSGRQAWHVVRLDDIYRLVSQLTLFGFIILKHG